MYGFLKTSDYWLSMYSLMLYYHNLRETLEMCFCDGVMVTVHNNDNDNDICVGGTGNIDYCYRLEAQLIPMKRLYVL